MPRAAKSLPDWTGTVDIRTRTRWEPTIKVNVPGKYPHVAAARAVKIAKQSFKGKRIDQVNVKLVRIGTALSKEDE